MENSERHYNFSSSQIHRLTTNGKAKDSIGAPFYTYVQEKIYEKRLQRALTGEVHARPNTWGQYLEMFAFEKLGIQYKLESKIRYKHISLSWSGAPDLITENIVGDIKCPYTLLAFCKIIDELTKAEKEKKPIAEALKKAAKEYYWQLISNAVLTGKDECELVIYMPYEEDLIEIQERASPGVLSVEDSHKYSWIYYSQKETLPFLKKEGYYKDLNVFKFIAPEEDKEFLVKRLTEATKLLNEA